MKKNPFEQVENSVVEKAIEPKEIQKAEIFSALKQYNNPVMIKKTGKEIKEQIKNVILPYLLSKKEEIQKSLNDFIANTTILPTKPCYMRIGLEESEFPYKMYSWEEINWSVEKSFGQIFKGFGDVEAVDSCEGEECEKIKFPYYPQSKEEADSRRKYNNLVEDFRDLIMDIKTANVLLNNLQDKEVYYLNIEQLVGLKFDNQTNK